MSMQDTIADMLTRIRNASAIGNKKVVIPSTKVKIAIAKVMKEYGFIEDYTVAGDEKKPELVVRLKHFRGKPVIETIQRISRPGLRVYKKYTDIPVVKGGLGIAIISTPMGVMSSIEAHDKKQGGEVICYLS